MFEEFIPFVSVAASFAALLATWRVTRQQMQDAKELKQVMRSLEEESSPHEGVLKNNADALRNQILQSLETEKGRTLTELQKNAEVVRTQIAVLAKNTEELSKDGALDYSELLFLLRQMDQIQSGAKQSVLEHAKSNIPAKQH